MNFAFYFVMIICCPLLISTEPYRLQMAFRKINSKPTEFELIIENCFLKLNPLDADVFTCLSENQCKIGVEDLACCIRVVQYKCMKIWLTTKCNLTQEFVQKNDEQHFNLWKNMYLGFKGNCTQNSTESLKHCNLADEMSDVDEISNHKLKWSITLQLTVITCFVFASIIMLVCLNYKFQLFKYYSYNDYII